MEELKVRAVYEYTIQRQKTLEIREDKVSGPDGIASLMRGLGLAEKEQEHFYVFFLDAKNKIKGYSLVTIGLVDRTQVHAREIFRNAIIQGATNIILGHNHPSGDCTPSDADLKCTRQTIEAGKIIGIDVLDHVIIGQPNALGKDYLSFKEQFLM